ncbi:MAG: ABC transporter permease [Nitrospirota bacterium]|nr:ABC transporter permease [Nitrospirota bacterium]
MMRLRVPLGIMMIWGIMALLGLALPLTPNAVDLTHILVGPGQDQWLGYDELGRPIADRLIIGAKISFLVSISVVALGLLLGGILGLLSGYLGGMVDQIFVRIVDIMLAFPGLLLAIALAGALGPGIENVVFALVIVGWVGYARLTRGQVLALKHADHVIAAQAIGATPWRIMWQHLLPLVTAPLIIEASFGIAGAIIAEAGLSFLGLGVQPPEASWGSMIRDGTRYMLVAPHLVIIPGLTLMAVVLAANLLGDWLRDWLDVKEPQHTR